MQPIDVLLWGVRTLSIFNTIAFVWLGLTVLLNAQERKLATWVTGAGLLLTGVFFALHSTFVGRDVGSFEGELIFWWPYLWLLFVIPPYIWYLVIGSYSGAFDTGPHRAQLLGVTFLGAGALALMALPGALPSYESAARGEVTSLLAVFGVSVALLVYPAHSALCFALSLVAIYRPGESRRFMGDLGRKRARPWLVAACVLLLGVSFAVGGVAGWVLHGPRLAPPDFFAVRTLTVLLAIDLGVQGLLALVIVLLGRAIVSYEIFTGRALPRGGLLRHWRNSLVLAAGYGVLMGGSLGLPVEPIYRLMLATALIAIFYALLSWRSYVERERGMEQLRPFVASERLYERLLRTAGPLEVDVEGPFRALCQDVLGARVAYLIPLGPMAPLVEKPLSYPPQASLPPALPAGLSGRLNSPDSLTVPVDPLRFGGARWAVGLWSERGLIGALLLGEKRDGGLYVQEEIEVARSAGERLIDLQAGAEMARRLMAVQRQRLAESQLMDRQARRVLHDDVLPQLHTAVLGLSGNDGKTSEVVEGLVRVHRRISDLLRAMPGPASPELGRAGLVGALRGAVERELSGAFDDVGWEIDPEAERRARELPPLSAEVVYGAAREAIRNAARHGRGGDASRSLRLSVSVAWRDGLEIRIEDDGVGLQPEGITEGSGQGLALHSTMVGVIGGTLAVEGTPEGGTLAVEGTPEGGTRVTLGLPA